MKNSSIKNKIIYSFFISGIKAFILTFGLFILFFGTIHLISNELYNNVLNLYNNSILFMMGYTLIVFVMFLLFMYILFSRRMNKITDYIKEISSAMIEISKGDLNINIPVESNDELGILASNVNKMEHDLKELMDKEREWGNERNNLITNLSHDLRTPLTSILGFINLISKETCENTKINHYCSISLKKAEELKASIDKLFEFAKITNSDFKIDKKEICVQELVGQVLVGFIPLFEENNMEYRIHYTEQNIKICVDPVLIARAFENIITNTIKYAKEGKYLDVNIKKMQDKTAIEFINYGNKIEKDNLDNIFNKYYRAAKSSNKKEGTGLGLAIVKTIVELNGGKINASSTDNETVFKFEL